MKRLKIERVENGFMVHVSTEQYQVPGKIWAFETGKNLAEFIETWANTQEDATSSSNAKDSFLT